MRFAPFYVIVGLGVTGIACARYLAAHGYNFALNDTRKQPPRLAELKAEFPQVQIALGELDFDLLSQATAVIVSPGLPLIHPVLQKVKNLGIPLWSDIELFAQFNRRPVIAITGTNAKSTVTTLVAHMAEAAGKVVAVGGNLGTPALALLQQYGDKADVYVLELSSFQLEATHSLAPQVATILNITPDHMDRYADFQAYRAAKLRIYQHCQHIVYNFDDALTDAPILPAQHKLSFSLQGNAPADFTLLKQDNKTYLAFRKQPLMATAKLPVLGRHYQANALAALAIGYSFGLPFTAMLQVLETFTGLAHRCQFLRELNGVRWYNDSKGTNVGATYASIEGIGQEIKGKIILIAGGVGKNADFSPLIPAVSKYVSKVILLGEAASNLEQVFSGHVPLMQAATMTEAVQLARAQAMPEDCVLLSPACASFDMFRDFAHRGDVFSALVREL